VGCIPLLILTSTTVLCPLPHRNVLLHLALESFCRPLHSVHTASQTQADRAAAVAAVEADDALSDCADSTDLGNDDPAHAVAMAIAASLPAAREVARRREAARIRSSSASQAKVETMDAAQWLHMATRDYQCALRLHPYCAPARLNLAVALLVQGKYRAARRQLAAFEGVVDPASAIRIKVPAKAVCVHVHVYCVGFIAVDSAWVQGWSH